MKKKTNKLAIAKSILTRALIYIELLMVVVIVLYPILWVIGSSFNPINSVGRASIIPQNATFDNYITLFTKTGYVSWFLNTGYIAVMTMVFSVLVNTLTAFVLARFRFKGRKAGMLLVMILQTFPPYMSMTALYMVALNFGMLDNLNMLVIIYVAVGIPINIWLARGYLLNLPRSIDEAAYIDGASKLQVFARIILPLSVPIVSFIALTSFMLPWMDYMLPRLLIGSVEKQTVAMGLYNMVDIVKNQTQYSITTFCAGAVLLAVPITILYAVFQRFLITGVASGANKGE
ncbi:MAG: sugar ABC transporter permease [Oscillospiraceae bacterium]|nr:sugar ABC transporter permease [Oscillospiraceae bacterium]